jgi:tetratricopeptide (TPR) repeat protein
MTRWLVLVVALLLWTAPAAAQQQNLVLEHFRAYRAALDRGDYEAAEYSAEQALGASEFRDGDGGRTAVLALNLASARLTLGKYAEAREPARRALSLAEAQGEASGVDALLAEVILGRAELGAGEEAGVARLLSALPRADGRADIVGETYPAAFELALWLFAHERYREARDAWGLSGRFAEGSPMGAQFGRGRSRTWEGASVVMAGIQGTSHRLSIEDARTADALFDEAAHALGPLARVEADSGAMTVAQASFAEAMVWRRVMRAQMGSRARRLDRMADEEAAEEEADAAADAAAGSFEIFESSGADASAPYCAFRIRPTRMPRYPGGALNNLSVGAVVVRFQFNDAAELVDRQIAAHVGGQDFADSVARVLPDWTIEYGSARPPQCRMPASAFQSIVFRVD